MNMERLTEYSCGVAVIRNKNLINKAMYDLARYEDTGLTPEEVRALKQESKNVQVDYYLLEYYKTLGTVVQCRRALEKQKPQKIKFKQWEDTKCVCGYEFSRDLGDGYHDIPIERKTKYCPDCGQKLQWDE
jgi:hypothetical protein